MRSTSPTARASPNWPSEIAAASGGIDVLVNCAGTITQKTLATMTAAEWDRVIDVNLGGTFNGIHAVIAAHAGHRAAARSSTSPRSPGGGFRSAAAPIIRRRRPGVLGLTRHAAYELAPDHIRVNAVCPGPTATPFSGKAPTPEQKAQRAKKIPLGRMVEPEDIADAVLFLAGDGAKMVTGIALDVDGGVLISNDIPYEEYFAKMK